MKITNENNMELMKRYKDNHFDLAIIDPPYKQSANANANASARTFLSTSRKLSGGEKYIRLDHGIRKIDLGDRPGNDFFEELFRVSKNQMVFGMQFFTPHLPPNQCCIVWDKEQGEGMKFSDFELIWTSFPTRTRIFKRHRFKGKSPKEYQNEQIHITQKPVRLYEWLLLNYSKEGDKILDTHLGSGSIAIACHNLQRNLTGCELNEEYYNSAIKRIKNHTNQLRINNT